MATKEKKEKTKEGGSQKSEGKTTKVSQLLELVESMTPLELAEGIKAMEEKFGVSSAAPVTVAATTQTPTGETQPQAEEKTTFEVELTEAGANKIAVIKVLKELKPELGLKEAKDLVDGAPKTILEGAKKEVAEEAKKKLEAVGAKVTLK